VINGKLTIFRRNAQTLVFRLIFAELDRLKIVQYQLDNPYPRYSGKVTAAARSATEWLLSIQQQSRETGHGAIRFQKWSERHDKFLRKADDKIVDCAMFFMDSSRMNVKLWTGDKNLALVVSYIKRPFEKSANS
jgi:hypothetical protein